MKRTRHCLVAALAAFAILFTFGTAAAQTSLDFILKPYLSRYDLPALAAAVVKDGKVIAAGLGPQSSLGRIDAPLGHGIIDGKMKAFLAGPNGDGPALIGPAGANCTPTGRPILSFIMAGRTE